MNGIGISEGVLQSIIGGVVGLLGGYFAAKWKRDDSSLSAWMVQAQAERERSDKVRGELEAEQRRRIEELERENVNLRQRISGLEEQISALRGEVIRFYGEQRQ